MADDRKDSKKEKTSPFEPVVVLLIIVFVFNLLTGIPGYLEERFGLSFGNISSALSGKPIILPLGSNLKLGDEVVTSNNALIYANPGDDSPIGSVSAGIIGEIIDGPITIDGEEWWKVRFEDGSVGWVRGDALIGSDVVTKNETEVFSNPGDSEVIFSVPRGTIGKIIGGPIFIAGETWWEVEFEDSSQGWVRESDLGAIGEAKLSGFSVRAIAFLKVFTVFASLILLTFIVYTFIRLKSVQLEVNKKFNNYYEAPEGTLPENDKWRKILGLVESDNPNDWRQAVIEADVILDEAVSKKGYRGENLGEKMKGIDPSDFTTLDYAWDAHKVRNKIAHDGGDFILTEREAKRVVGLYGAVLKEFGWL
jgi:hypothetical protein